MTEHLLGIDTGGTFTDFVYLHNQLFQVHKVLSTPHAPQEAIFKGISEMGLEKYAREGQLRIVHGTTVATNATLEGKGVPTAYITNRGLADVLEIGRQTRPELYHLDVKKPQLNLPSEFIFEVNARMDSRGNIISDFLEDELEALKQKVKAVSPRSIAINLLFSFVNDSHERAIEKLFQQDSNLDSPGADNEPGEIKTSEATGHPETFISRSSFVLPEYREYERGITTWVNAWIGPLIDEYLRAVQAKLSPSPVAIMQSSGVTISADQAARRAVNLLLSGPVGGLQAARTICQGQKLMTFDMGGTSTDVALVDGDIRLSSESTIANLPIAVAMADIHTIGAGGGSIAFIDEGGLLQVGPGSAGANPGPACYGLGGKNPTVTDANLVLGRLQADNFLGGSMQLDTKAAYNAIESLAKRLAMDTTELAQGIVSIANEHMIQALRVISIQRGIDPRDFALVCFGGAGGLHFCDLAEALEMTRAIVPINSGVLSALGMLATRPGRDLARTQLQPLEGADAGNIRSMFLALSRRGREELMTESTLAPNISYSLDLRYLGQTFTLAVQIAYCDGQTREPEITSEDLILAEETFHRLHEQRYGHRLEKPVELLNLRVHLEIPGQRVMLPKVAQRGREVSQKKVNLPGQGEVPVYERGRLEAEQQITGPALITETHATTLIKSGWTAEVDSVGNLNLERRLT